MNFTSSEDDIRRFNSTDEIIKHYTGFGLDGLELMPFFPVNEMIKPEMVTGVHCVCIADWMSLDKDWLISYYKENLDYAESIHAKYVVFHVVQCSNNESFTYKLEHTDEEVINASISFINQLLDGQNYSFEFLMENLWWPGLTFLKPELARKLINEVHYEKKGFMLDTGHLLHTDLDIETQEEAVVFINKILDMNEDLIPYMRGVHLQQSLTGSYVKDWLSHDHEYPDTDEKFYEMLYYHLFSIDKHLPFTADGVSDIIKRIKPAYVTLEYITTSLEENKRFLSQGLSALLK